MSLLNTSAGDPPSSSVEAAWAEIEAGNHAGATQLLEHYLASGADDVLAETELVECLEYAGRYPKALDLLSACLLKRPRHPLLLRAKARVKSALGNFDEALTLVDDAIRAWEALPVGIGWAPPTEFFAQLVEERWSLLYDLQRYGEALELAKSNQTAGPSRWTDKVRRSLVAAGHLDQAEAAYPAEWAIDAPWFVATDLMYLQRYKDSLSFVLRRLAYVTRPKTIQFKYVLGYMECLMFAKNTVEFERATDFWLQQGLTKTRRMCVRALQIAAKHFQVGPRAARLELNSLLGSHHAARQLRLMRDEYAFERTGEMLAEILGSLARQESDISS